MDKYNKKMFFYYILLAIVTLALMARSLDTRYESYVQIAFSGVFVFVTTIYVVVTAEILKDNQKTREIAYIERQIEIFYIPFKQFFTYDVKTNFRPNAYGEARSSRPHVFLQYIDNPDNNVSNDELVGLNYDNSDSIFKELEIHKYLSLKKSRDVFSRFFTIMNEGNKVSVTDMRTMIEDLDLAIESDTNQLMEKLDHLN